MRLLIIGVLEGHISTASKIAMDRGAQVAHVTTIEDGLIYLRSGKGADIALVDVSLKIESFVKGLKKERIHTPVVACGIGTDSQSAVGAIKAGAKEYLPLPPDAELIAGILEAVAQESDTFLYRDPNMESLIALVDRVAPSDASILISGESGTGKEVMARYIHRKSHRKSKQFISINCAAIPDNLLESELFGHEKGAFTGAVARRIGKFEEANGGTLLLDEITEMDPRLQAKLLRAIQEREIDRVGGNKSIPVDIRLIATSNRDIEKAVKEGQFREDLYFRLNVFTVELPPLHARIQDVPLLADHFAEKYSLINGVAQKPFSDKAYDKMIHYTWPGNIRELENTIHRAVLLATGPYVDEEAIILPRTTTLGSAPSVTGEGAHTQTPSGEGLVGRTVAEVEKDLIMGTLSKCLGNRTHAANILGISIRTLRNKLNAYAKSGAEGLSKGAEVYSSAGSRGF